MPTTSSSPPLSARDTVVHALNRCVEAGLAAQKGYATAAADASDEALKTILQLRSDERAELVVALQHAVREMGGWAENHGSLEGTLHRAWMLLGVAGYNPRLPYSLRAMIVKQHGIVRACLADLGTRLGRNPPPA